MAMRREGELQGDLLMTWAEMPRSPGHVFYNRLQELLSEAGFDAFVEETCKPFYAPKMGAPSLPPGRYFRMHMIGYFEGLASERGIVWRCADSRSLGDFLRLGSRDKVPDHSCLSKTGSRLPHEVYEKVFEFVLKLVAERGLVKGERIGVDASTMEANAALRSIVHDSGETYREMLTIDDLIQLDRKRKGKRLSNEDWASKTDPDAKIVISTRASLWRRRSTAPTKATRRHSTQRLRRRERTSLQLASRRRPKILAISWRTRAIIHAMC